MGVCGIASPLGNLVAGNGSDRFGRRPVTIGMSLLLSVAVGLFYNGASGVALTVGLALLFLCIGGIMVPKFVMPETMRHVAELSPMSWGLEGFLDVMLRGGGLAAIAPEAAGLTGLGLVAILLAGALYQRRMD